jgi:hypothetical protein
MAEKTVEKPKEFDLVDDYKSKAGYLKDHFTRMWTRFNFFLSIHSGLFFGTVIASDKNKWWIPLFGILAALVWYVFGAQDRYLVALYKQEVERTAANIESKYKLENYTYIGQTENTENLKVVQRIYQWRSDLFSTTKLAAWFPLAVLLLWLVRFISLLEFEKAGR